MSERPTHPLGHLASLPNSATGPAHLVWWGNFGFMLIEGTAFVLAAGAYLYLMARSPAWPPAGDGRPDLFWGAAFTLALLASEIPNLFLLRKAKAKDARATRLLALTMVACGLLLAGLRAAE